jgi:hypothetical protein
LQASNPDVLTKANSVLAILTKSQPNITYKENDYPFVECATLADDCKYGFGEFQSNWHYINDPYFDDGGNVTMYPKYGATTQNLSLAVSDIVMWLKHLPGYNTTLTYKSMTKSFSENDAMSLALRFLIHYIGDYHQPLHCT